MDDQSILIRQERGHAVDWYDMDYYGPFSSQEEREAWEAANPLEDSHNERYTKKFLSK